MGASTCMECGDGRSTKTAGAVSMSDCGAYATVCTMYIVYMHVLARLLCDWTESVLTEEINKFIENKLVYAESISPKYAREVHFMPFLE